MGLPCWEERSVILLMILVQRRGGEKRERWVCVLVLGVEVWIVVVAVAMAMVVAVAVGSGG